MYSKTPTSNTNNTQNQPTNHAFFPQNNNTANPDRIKNVRKRKSDAENERYRSRALLELTNKSGSEPSEDELANQMRLVKKRDAATILRNYKKNESLKLKSENENLNSLIENLTQDNNNLLQKNEILWGMYLKLRQKKQQLKNQQPINKTMKSSLLRSDYRTDEMHIIEDVNNHDYNSNYFFVSPVNEEKSDSADYTNVYMHNNSMISNTSNQLNQPTKSPFFSQNNNTSNPECVRKVRKPKSDEENERYKCRALLELKTKLGREPSNKELVYRVKLLKNEDYVQALRNELLNLKTENEHLNSLVENFNQDNNNLSQQNEILLDLCARSDQKIQQLINQETSNPLLWNDYEADDMRVMGDENNHDYDSNCLFMNPEEEGKSDLSDYTYLNSFIG